MAVSDDYLSFVKEQLSDFGILDVKRMFGGVGIFHKGLMFGKIGNDILRFRVDEINQKDYEEKGMKPYHSEKKKKGMPYWEVPSDVLEDKEKLVKWATIAYDCAVRNKK